MKNTCSFCCREVFLDHEASPNGPEKLVGNHYCSASCRANDVLLAHIDIRQKYPNSLTSYSVLLGIKI